VFWERTLIGSRQGPTKESTSDLLLVLRMDIINIPDIGRRDHAYVLEVKSPSLGFPQLREGIRPPVLVVIGSNLNIVKGKVPLPPGLTPSGH